MKRILMIWLAISVFKPDVFGQDKSVPLIDYIKELEEHYGVKFSYNHDLAANTRIEPVPIGELEGTLTKALVGSGVGFMIEGDAISLYPDKKNKKRPKSRQSLQAVIVDSDGGETLPNAVVQLSGDDRYTVSNRDGLFSLPNIPPDTTKIRISYLGYSPYETTVASLRESGEIRLEARPELLDEVVIAENEPAIIQIPDYPGQITLNARYLNNLTSFGEKDAFRSLQLLPGISGTGESSTELRIRGGTPDQNLVLFDGFTVYQLDHFFGAFSAFNSHVIKDIQIYKGGFGAEYGGRVSSVVDMIGKNGNQEKISGRASVNLLSTSAALEVPVNDRISLVLAGRRSFTDLIQSNLFDQLFEQVNDENDVGRSVEEDEDISPDFYFFDFNAKASWKISSADLLQFSLYRGKDNLKLQQLFDDEGDDFFFEQSIRQDSEWGNQGESLRYARNWNSSLFTEVMATHSTFFRDQRYREETFFEYSSDLFIDEIDFTDENKIEEFSLNLSADYSPNQTHNFNIGSFFNSNTISYRSLFFDEEDLNLDLTGIYTGVFVNHRYQPANRLTINSGLRYTFYELIQKNYLEPRLSAIFKLTDQLQLKGAYGRYYQFVGRVTTFDNSFGQDDFWLLRGIEDSPVISANHYTLGTTFKVGPVQFDMEVYRKDLDGLSSFKVDSIPDEDDSFEVGDLTRGKGQVKGIDFLIKRESPTLTSWISYTLSESTNRFLGIDDGDSFSANFDQRHEVKVVNSFQYKAWNFTSSWIYGSGRPYTPRFVNLEEEEDFIIGGTNSERLPDYHRLDLNVSYLKTFGSLDMRFSLNLLNIYHRSNVRSIFLLEQFDDDDDEFVAREEEVKMLGFTPSLGIEINF